MRVIVSCSDGRSLLDFFGCFVRDTIARGHEVICLSCEPPEEMESKVEALGASYRMVPMSRAGTNILQDLKTMRFYKKLLKELKPDVYFASMSKPVAYGGLAAVACKIPKIDVQVSGLEICFYSGGVKNALIRKLLLFLYGKVHKHCENIFFLNPDDYKVFHDAGIATPEQSTRIYGCGVEMEHYYRTPLPDAPVFLMAARLVWSKGIREYLAAAREVKAEIPNARFLLIGRLDDNSEALTKAELDAFSDAGIVEYLGFSEDIRRELTASSVFVLPSYHEGTPRTVLEAMSMGRAILTTDAPGARETVREGENGYLVPVGDVSSLAARMKELALDATLRSRMGEASYQMCQELFEAHGVNRVMLDKMQL